VTTVTVVPACPYSAGATPEMTLNSRIRSTESGATALFWKDESFETPSIRYPFE
jgi:hypothetical protein